MSDFEKFHKLCAYNGWGYTLTWTESDGLYEGTVIGIGQGESFYNKKIGGGMRGVLEWLVETAFEHAENYNLNIHRMGLGDYNG